MDSTRPPPARRSLPFDWAAGSPPPSSVVVAILIALTGIFLVATIRDGHLWGGDFALYVLHAKNLVMDRDYAATGYIASTFYGPATYPPVFPMMLAPIYEAFGFNLLAMKLLLIGCFLIALWLIYRVISARSGPRAAIVVVLLIGFNPWFWNFKDEIVSDLPFLMFTYLTLDLIRYAAHREADTRRQLIFGLLIGASMYLAYGTRSIGLMLVPTLFGYEILRGRRRVVLMLGATALFAVLYLVQKATMHGVGGYMQYFSLDPGLIVRNAVLCLKIFSAWFEHEDLDAGVRIALYAPIAALVAVGFFRGIRDFGVLEVFAVFYVVPILLFDNYILERYLVPLIPLFMLYLVLGAERFVRLVSGPYRRALGAVLAVALVGLYADMYRRMDFERIPHGISSAETRDMVRFVREKTDPGDVFVVFRPRTFALLTERRAAGYYGFSDHSEFREYLDSIGAGYLVIADDTLDPGLYGTGPAFLRRHVERTGDFERVYTNRSFDIFDIGDRRHGEIGTPGAASPSREG